MFNLKLIAGGLVCVAVGFGAGSVWQRPTRLTFLSVGQGDCAVFQHEGSTILIDCGPKNPKVDAGEKIIVPNLREMGVDGVDMILLSHPDIDHIGGTGSVLRAYPDATVAVSACFRQNQQLLKLLSQWGRSPEKIKWLGPEYQGELGAFKIRIDCPQSNPDEETNDGSMIVRIQDGAASAVFTGDAPAKVEKAFDRVIDWRSEVLKAGHHGSRSASCEEWIEAVHPEYAIISCGLNNEYHHPHAEVMNRLKEDHIKICRTDQEGNITFVLRNGRFEREDR